MEIVIPAPPNVDIKRKPSEEQLAQVLERTPIEEPEKNKVALSSCLTPMTILIDLLFGYDLLLPT